MLKRLMLGTVVLALMSWKVSLGQTVIYRDDFSYNHDFGGGVPGFNPSAETGSAIWEGVYSPTAGGQNTAASSGSGTLLIGMDEFPNGARTQWENNIDNAPLLYRQVDVEDFISVTAKISSMTEGNWNLAGPMVREPNPIDGVAGQENWFASWSFRVAVGDYRWQRNRVLNGVEDETPGVAGLGINDANYVRVLNKGLVDVGGQIRRRLKAEYSADGLTWFPSDGTGSDEGIEDNTNVNLVSGLVEVGVTGWGQDLSSTPGGPTGTNVQFDWVEIEVASSEPSDCELGIECVWRTNGPGDFNAFINWSQAANPPNSNTVAAVFGDALTGPAGVVYTNTAVTVKELRFDNAGSQYVLAGAGQVNLEADSGDALINILSGSHQIQVNLALADNVLATAETGATLDINAPIYLNGHTLTTAGDGTINLNVGTVAGGGGGGGSVVNDGNLVALAGVEGDLYQSEAGSLGVVVGGSPIVVLGEAVLDGVLDVSLADGFRPSGGQSYTVLTASSVTDLGLSLSGSAAGRFRLSSTDGALLLTAVPEPAAASLLLIACVAAAVPLHRNRGRR
jgi:hypothetical protein